MSDLRDSLVQSGTLIGYLNTIVYAHNYNDLSNKPQINGVTLTGNKTPSELGLVTPATEAVQSVNGETGSVVLDGNDIAYNSNNTINQQIDAVAASIPVMAVTSVNGETGDVVLEGSDIRYDSDYTVSAKIAAVEGEIPVVPVQSVNGETGAVVLDGDDIAYNSSLSVNQKIDAIEAAIPVVSYPVTSVNSKTGAVVLDDSDIEHSSGVSVNSLINTILDYTPVYGNEASGAIATFDTSLALPLQDCTIDINAVQEGSGTPSPDNVRPITGFTGANIKVAGKNLINITDCLNDYYVKSNELSVVSIEGANVFYCDVPKNTDLVLTPDKSNRCVILGYKIRPTTVAGSVGDALIVDSFYSITPCSFNTGDNQFLAIYVNRDSANKPTQIMLEVGTTATAHEEYNSTTTHITWQDEAGTVYGGSLNVTTGKLTVVNGSMGAGDYQITPIPINQLSGTNNIFCDTGNTSVVYACSLKDYIDSQ